MGEDVIYLCPTEGCEGLVDDPDEEPCPRCGRVINDPTAEELEERVASELDRLQDRLADAKKYVGGTEADDE